MIEAAKPHVRDGFLFPGIRKGVISDATMARLMERRGMDARPHGFRSSLCDWLAEATDAPHEVAEAAREMKAAGGYWEYWLIYKINYAERLRSISWPDVEDSPTWLSNEAEKTQRCQFFSQRYTASLPGREKGQINWPSMRLRRGD